MSIIETGIDDEFLAVFATVPSKATPASDGDHRL
jgi:hypothetical protein